MQAHKEKEGTLSTNVPASEAPVIVYGVDTQIGLNIIRELGKRGVKVIAIGKKPGAVGLYSRYVHQRHVLNNLQEEERIQALNDIQAQSGARFLLCVSEDDILFFNLVATRLTGLTPLVPGLDEMAKVLDKQQTMTAAEAVGIEVPRSFQLDAYEKLEEIIGGLRFPAILKWANPHDVMKPAGNLGIKIEKLRYVYSADELRQVMAGFIPLGHYPLIQEYCAGHGLGQFFFIHKGQDLLRFQHRRIHEWPPEGGYSSLCEAIPLTQFQALQEKSLALLRALNWTGVAMVEYRYDPKENRAVLMEINGRFWGSYPLAYHANAPFAWFSYQVLGLGKTPRQEPLNEHIRCRNLLVELKRLYRICFRADLIQDKSRHFSRLATFARVFTDFFSPSTRYYLFDWRDPKPAMMDLLGMLKKLLRIGG
ncbi:hypothetical protein P2G88_03490 [Aliiglaciecola sp. CAU 1673]|uniref:carboxylate--amine ligase n=1 Tax=Aliiglaciecola sp. CAU 1673 TaxID=3032595 RepID=UPI0023DAB577|nr:hypothetical protein [Aliiglaciecola sp. CAU 1673]MDF2177306.1 hypothetical protein [Aliiglaciecola sp. CAU 1673]